MWKLPIALMGFSHDLRLCLQGGGVYIVSGTATFSYCTITGNSAGYVRDHAQKFPSPRWETHVCSACCLQGGGIRVGGGSVSLIYCQVHSNQASYVRGLIFKSSPLPDGKLTFCSLFAGRRCLCPFRHRHNDVLLDHRQHSFCSGACSCGNFPSP